MHVYKRYNKHTDIGAQTHVTASMQTHSSREQLNVGIPIKFHAKLAVLIPHV